MEKDRQTRLLIIVALVVSIVGISLGFAAFSNIIKISSSAAVKPNSSSFNVLFSSSNISQKSEPISGVVTGGASSEQAEINGTTISGLRAYFSKPGQSATYTFYAHNVGEYVAYLRNIYFGSGMTCSSGLGATDSLVQAACDDISISVNVGSTFAIQDASVSGHNLGIDKYEEVVVTITYSSGGDMADGDFSVYFDNITFEYSSTDSVVELITFSIAGKTYNAEKNMTFQDWINSSYNTDGYTSTTKFYSGGSGSALSLNATISANGTYTLTSSSGNGGGASEFVPSISVKPAPDLMPGS